MRLGSLLFNAVDIGERITMSRSAQSMIACGGLKEIAQRAPFRLSSVRERAPKKRPKRIPTSRRIPESPMKTSEVETGEARRICAEENQSSEVSEDPHSVARVVLSPHQDRDSRTVSLFLYGKYTNSMLMHFAYRGSTKHHLQL